MAAKVDTYVVLGASNRFYFTRLLTSFGCVVLGVNEKFFITDFRYAGMTKDLTDFTVITVEGGGLYRAVVDCCKRIGAKVIGYEDDVLTVQEFKDLKQALSDFTLKAAGEDLVRMRAVKSAEEIELIAASQALNEKALAKAVAQIKPGMTEKDLAALVTYEILRCGAENVSFEPIVAFGENTAVPHHHPSHKKLEKNDLILIDMGAKLNGYCSDLTRTFSLGEPNGELVKIHSIVLEAQNYALQHIKAGMTGHEADSLAREYIIANGFSTEFGHSLGHGVGVDIHEYPRAAKKSENILEENMVISVEPGIYVEGLGGVRIEDLVVVQRDGVRNLNEFSKTLNL